MICKPDNLSELDQCINQNYQTIPKNNSRTATIIRSIGKIMNKVSQGTIAMI